MIQQIVPWNTGIEASWVRANHLVTFSKHSPHADFAVELIEEGTEQHWRLVFSPYQAIRVTTIDCVHHYWESLGMKFPAQNGGFFEVLNSEWIQALGKGQINVAFLDQARHFIIHTYDDTIEVVAWDCEVSKLDRKGYTGF